MEDNIQHIYPLNDTEDHLLESHWGIIVDNDGKSGEVLCCNCKCEPDIRYEENGLILIVHDAFDGRLGVEWANEILK